jgi:transposase InsO family protein
VVAVRPGRQGQDRRQVLPADCGACPARDLCFTGSARKRRQLTLSPRDLAEAQAANREQEKTRCRARYLIRDRDGKFPGLFDAILSGAGIESVVSGVRMPRMNSIMERWVQTCRRELLDRTPIWNQSHLLHALREFEQFYNGHRPHQGIANARPLQPLPVPLAAPDRNASLHIRRRDRLGGVLHEYQHAA